MYLSRLGLNRPKRHNGYELDMIEPNLYLSGEAEASDVETLRKYKITHILTINDFPLPPIVKDTFRHIQIKYIRLPDMTTSDLMSYFDECYEFIKNGLFTGAVLVHCQMGVSRSATIIIAYLMKKYNITYREALNKVTVKRYVSPNVGFVSQLQRYKELNYSTMNVFGASSTRYMLR